jgi:hypothetical protein
MYVCAYMLARNEFNMRRGVGGGGGWRGEGWLLLGSGRSDMVFACAEGTVCIASVVCCVGTTLHREDRQALSWFY